MSRRRLLLALGPGLLLAAASLLLLLPCLTSREALRNTPVVVISDSAHASSSIPAFIAIPASQPEGAAIRADSAHSQSVKEVAPDGHLGSIQSEALKRKRIRRDRLPLARAHEIPPNETLASPAELADALFYCRAENDMLLSRHTSSSSATSDLSSLPAQPPNPLTHANEAWPSGGYFCTQPWTLLQPASDADPSPKVHVEYCAHTAEGLSGAFRISKLDNCLTSNTSYTQWTQDEEWRSLVLSTYASEEFSLTLVGVELVNLGPPRHLGRCRFEVSFHLRVPGRYLVDFVWTRENYAAVRDDVNAHPMAYARRPLGFEGLFVELGNASQTLQAHAEVLRAPKLPSCRGFADLSGRWVRTAPPDDLRNLFEKHYVPGKWKQLAFAKLEKYHWVPWHCRLPEMTALVNDYHCLDAKPNGGMELEIDGDSHGLRVLKGIGRGLCRDVNRFLNFTLKEGRPYTYRMQDCDSPIGLVVYNTAYSESVIKALRPTISRVTLLNFGSHQMQQPSPFATRFRPGLEDLVRHWGLLPSPTRSSKVVWYDIPISPFDRGGFVIGFHDGRTLARCTLWNLAAESRMRSVPNLLRVPLGSMSAPWYYNNPNNDGHYLPQVYFEVARAAAAMVCGHAGEP